MSKVKTGITAGIVFGIIDIIPMFFMGLRMMSLAVIGAFINRFAIGFLIPNTSLPFKGWETGLLIGLLLSLPDAIITNAYVPILSLGIIGGIVIGVITLKK
jgi:hypothetical protein